MVFIAKLSPVWISEGQNGAPEHVLSTTMSSPREISSGNAAGA
jgi:hypothetical protein